MKPYFLLLGGFSAVAALAGCVTAAESTGSGFAAAPAGDVSAASDSMAGSMPASTAGGPMALSGATPPVLEIGDDAGLEDLLRYAAEQSPQLRAAFAEWRAAVEREPQARALPDPSLSYGYFVERSTERLGMMGRQRISVTQMLPGFGKRGLRAEMADRAAEAAAERLEAARLAVFSRVQIAYAEYAYVTEAIGVLRELREVVRELEEVALARFRAGEVGSADPLRVEMEGARIADELRSMEEMRGPAAAVLNAALGRPPVAPLPDPRLEGVRALNETAEQELEMWLAGNPDLRAREREIARAEVGVELARRESWPDFMVGAEVLERRGEATEGMITVGLTLPIWRGNYEGARREAEANRNAAVARRESLERDLEAELRMAIFRVRDAERKMYLHGESLRPLARQAYESLAAAYRVGDTDFLNLVDAQRMLLNHELLHRRAMADQVQRLAELERLIGGGFITTGEIQTFSHD